MISCVFDGGCYEAALAVKNFLKVGHDKLIPIAIVIHQIGQRFGKMRWPDSIRADEMKLHPVGRGLRDDAQAALYCGEHCHEAFSIVV